jgi:hypothetical protein
MNPDDRKERIRPMLLPDSIPPWQQPLSADDLADLRRRRQHIPELLLRINCDVERLIATVDRQQVVEQRLRRALEYVGIDPDRIDQFVDDANDAIESTERLLRSTLPGRTVVQGRWECSQCQHPNPMSNMICGRCGRYRLFDQQSGDLPTDPDQKPKGGF